MTQSRTRPAPPARSRGVLGQTKYMVLGAVVIALLAGLAGWVLNDHVGGGSSNSVKVISTFTGKVTIVNSGGTAGCVQPASGKKVCSGFTVVGGGSGGGPAPRVGDTVHAAHEFVSTGGGNGYDLLLIYPQDAGE